MASNVVSNELPSKDLVGSAKGWAYAVVQYPLWISNGLI